MRPNSIAPFYINKEMPLYPDTGGDPNLLKLRDQNTIRVSYKILIFLLMCQT